MKINATTDYIRQQQLGQFNRPEDGKGPYSHVNGQKVESTKEQKNSSIYVNNEKIVALETDIESSFPKLFDSDAGMKFNIERINEYKKEAKPATQYDKAGKIKKNTKEKVFIDQLV